MRRSSASADGTSVADDRMADGGELHTDLVLQSGDEGDRTSEAARRRRSTE